MDMFGDASAMVLRGAPTSLRDRELKALLFDQTGFGGATLAHGLKLAIVSGSCDSLLNPDPADPLVNTGWDFRPPTWARLREWLCQR